MAGGRPAAPPCCPWPHASPKQTPNTHTQTRKHINAARRTAGDCGRRRQTPTDAVLKHGEALKKPADASRGSPHPVCRLHLRHVAARPDWEGFRVEAERQSRRDSDDFSVMFGCIKGWPYVKALSMRQRIAMEDNKVIIKNNVDLVQTFAHDFRNSQTQFVGEPHPSRPILSSSSSKAATLKTSRSTPGHW